MILEQKRREPAAKDDKTARRAERITQNVTSHGGISKLMLTGIQRCEGTKRDLEAGDRTTN